MWTAIRFSDNILVSPQPWVEPTTYSALKKTSSNRTFRNILTKEVFKIFDREDSIFLPNLQLMKSVGLEVSESRLSADGRYLVVKYPYIEGNHNPQSLQQFRGVLDILQKIHEQGNNLPQLHLFRGYKVCRVQYAPVQGGSSTSNLIEPSRTTSSQR